MIIGYAFVVADLFHYGHLHFLTECKKHCDFLIVGVYTDELTQSYKRLPIIPFKERYKMIEALKVVNKVVKVVNRDCTPMLKKLRAYGWAVTLLFHGSDWDPKKDADLLKSKQYIESVGGKLIQPKYYEGCSTTRIINEIIKRSRSIE